MALYRFSFKREKNTLLDYVKALFGGRFSYTSRNIITFSDTIGKAKLYGAVKVRIFGIPFMVALREEDYRNLAVAFKYRVNALQYATKQAHSGVQEGEFGLEELLEKKESNE